MANRSSMGNGSMAGDGASLKVSPTMKTHRLTHDDMKNRLLSGDEVDVTTRGEVEDFEIDRQPGNGAESLVETPTEHHKI